MTTERLTDATRFDAEKGFIVTSEANILNDGRADLQFSKADAATAEVVGRTNYEVYNLNLDDIDLDDQTLAERVRMTQLLDEWRAHLLRREVAVRSIELSLRSGMEHTNIGESLIAGSKDTPFDQPYSLLNRNKPSGRFVQRKAKQALDNGESLGDTLAALRLGVEDSMLLSASILSGKIGLRTNAISQSRGFRQGARKKHSKSLDEYIATPDGIRKSDAGLIEADSHLELTHEARMPDDLLHAFSFARTATKALINMRKGTNVYSLHTTPSGRYGYIPSNQDLYEKFTTEQSVPVRESITLRPAPGEHDPVAAAEKSRAHREQLQAKEVERQQAEQERKREMDEYNAPILAELARIKSHYDELLAPFLAAPKRSLRDNGIIGKNSLSYAVSQLDEQDIDSASRIANVYNYIKDLANDSSNDANHKLRDALLEIERLHAEYMTYLHANPLKNGAASRLESIDEGVKSELGWLTTHWEEFVASVENSSHAKRVTEIELSSVAALLGLQWPTEPEEVLSEDKFEADVETDEIETPDDIHELDDLLEGVDKSETIDEEPKLSALATANRLAEQLSWVVLPNEHITPDDLVETAKKVSSGRSKDGKPATIERYRMEALLKLREEYGGTLYRSDERTLDDTDNLYFVLRFEHDGDGNYYAVAENPVYGNATYILREDALPLMPGESVLSALKLRRSDVRGIGAERIIHGTPDTSTHLEKIDAKLVGLSQRERVATH